MMKMKVGRSRIYKEWKGIFVVQLFMDRMAIATVSF